MLNVTAINSSFFNEKVTEVPNFHREAVWTADLAITGCVTTISIYVAVALAYHEARVQKRKKVSFSQLSQEKKTAILSKYICILVAFISVLNDTTSILILWVETKIVSSSEDHPEKNVVIKACRYLPKVESTSAIVGTGFVYLFLWFRQRIFYIHPSIKVLNTKCIKGLNVLLFATWLVYFLPGLVSMYVLVEFKPDASTGCLIDTDDVETYQILIFSWIGMSIFLQVVLLALFIYPILAKSMWLKKNRTGKTLLNRAKKAVVLAMICLVSDVLSGVFTGVLEVKNANTIFFIYNLNLIINHLVTIACFDNWKSILFPWTAKKTNFDNYQSTHKNSANVLYSKPTTFRTYRTSSHSKDVINTP